MTCKYHKAKLVAQGFTQKQGVHYDGYFASVIKASSCALLTIASWRAMVIKHVDVKTTYRHACMVRRKSNNVSHCDLRRWRHYCNASISVIQTDFRSATEKTFPWRTCVISSIYWRNHMQIRKLHFMSTTVHPKVSWMVWPPGCKTITNSVGPWVPTAKEGRGLPTIEQKWILMYNRRSAVRCREFAARCISKCVPSKSSCPTQRNWQEAKAPATIGYFLVQPQLD